ncbi:hypothetical protein CAOG_05485 [Capsaspora owczarzaki ATCC 30864]|uniref:Uncharacterized protein n=1 Tax=Capsaspora owczarzaki (strain ATCC 30864) TaxID=595528 RepID=A0A0D2UII0_CAPO3|nr:hypothetical protein CAOG_05485 [Capsaspora owczarzaki ATCC 30864]KJE94946.1 hypothetical protein CAOG_005485 [Capsaspora owczarzaki ATCC 30864]|eukprot:XP_004346158.1 hypothetical protein CAOG_05485 [Capsaspora owczarzaki ATCC 30864]
MLHMLEASVTWRPVAEAALEVALPASRLRLDYASHSTSLDVAHRTMFGIYVFFPISLYYFFNLPHTFAEDVQARRKESRPQGEKPPTSIAEVREYYAKQMQNATTSEKKD